MRNIINTLKYTLYIQIGWIKWVLDPLRRILVLFLRNLVSFLWNPVPVLWNPVIPAESGPSPVDSCPTPVDSTGVLWVLQEWGGHWKVLRRWTTKVMIDEGGTMHPTPPLLPKGCGRLRFARRRNRGWRRMRGDPGGTSPKRTTTSLFVFSDPSFPNSPTLNHLYMLLSYISNRV